MLGVVRVREVVESDVVFLQLSVFRELVVIPGPIGREERYRF